MDERHIASTASEIVAPGQYPGKLFRFFDQEEHAERFVRGHIRLSSLSRCREHEDIHRMDGNEGCLYRSDSNGNLYVQQLADAHVLCMSDSDTPQMRARMGSYCVEIFDVDLLFRALTVAIRIDYPPETRVIALFGNVRYSGTYVNSDEADNRPIGLVKNPYFAPEREVRMLWTAGKQPRIVPREVHAPASEGASRRIA